MSSQKRVDKFYTDKARAQLVETYLNQYAHCMDLSHEDLAALSCHANQTFSSLPQQFPAKENNSAII